MNIKTTKSGKVVRAGVKSGKYKLRLVGGEKKGYRLAGQQGDNFFVFGQTYKNTRVAIVYGQNKLGVEAEKVVNRAKAKATKDLLKAA